MNTTCAGNTCGKWLSKGYFQSDMSNRRGFFDKYHYSISDSDFPVDGTLRDASNYCRNPRLSNAGDYCQNPRPESRSATIVPRLDEKCCLNPCEGTRHIFFIK